MKNMKPTKYRARVRHFVEENGKRIVAKWTAEFCINRKWLPLGTDEGLSKFDTKEAAEAAAREGMAALSS